MDAPLVRDLGFRPLPGRLGRDAGLHGAAHRRHARRDLVRRAPARLHARHARGSQPSARARRHPRRANRPRRASHVPRPRPARRLRAAESASGARWTPRKLVQALESAVIDTVAAYGVEANARRDAPGVYVAGAKLAAVGLRVKRHCSYHGLAVNVAMDLTPFARHQSVRLSRSARHGPAHARRHRGARALSRGLRAAPCCARLAPGC